MPGHGSQALIHRLGQPTGRDGVELIYVDARYMLWVMSELDGADDLLREMRIVYPVGER